MGGWGDTWLGVVCFFVLLAFISWKPNKWTPLSVLIASKKLLFIVLQATTSAYHMINLVSQCLPLTNEA